MFSLHSVVHANRGTLFINNGKVYRCLNLFNFKFICCHQVSKILNDTLEAKGNNSTCLDYTSKSIHLITPPSLVVWHFKIRLLCCVMFSSLFNLRFFTGVLRYLSNSNLSFANYLIITRYRQLLCWRMMVCVKWNSSQRQPMPIIGSVCTSHLPLEIIISCHVRHQCKVPQTVIG